MNGKEKRYYKKKINNLTKYFQKLEIKDSKYNLHIHFNKLALNDLKPSERIYKITNMPS